MSGFPSNMINAGQMETIPLSSDSESGNETHVKPTSFSSTTDSFSSASQIMSMGDRSTAATLVSDGKSSLGPTPDLIPRTDNDTIAGVKGRLSLSNPAAKSINATTERNAVTNAVDENEDEADEEKQRLIAQVLELQHTLEDLSSRVDSVKEENLKLRSENQILGQYIENLMAASSVFQSSTPRMRRKASSGQNTSKSTAVKLQQ